MTDRATELKALLDQNAEAKCAKFFAGLPESDRRELAKVAIPVFKQAVKIRRTESGVDRDPRFPAAQIAALATGSLSELKSLGWQMLPPAKTAFELLADRRPPWLTELADHLIANNAFCWPLVRTLVRRGLCERPAHENYTLGMFVTLDGWRTGWFIEPASKSVVANLRADKDLLTREVWELFRVEGQGELTLAAHDKYIGGKGGEHGWAGALCALAQTGELPRGRLLDESLEALSRGFSQFRVAWFSRFHELLEPTAAERHERLNKYLVLLASPIPPTVTFALDALDLIDKPAPLAVDPVLDALAPVLMARHKGTAVRAVQWLNRLAERDAARRGEIACVAAAALVHEAADVQKAALAMIEKHGSAANAKLYDSVAAAEMHVAASLRKRLTAWLAAEEATSSPNAKSAKPAVASKPKKGAPPTADLSALEREAASLPAKWRTLAGVDALLASVKLGSPTITALDFGPLDVPRLDPQAAIEPLTDLDAWIDACAHFLENRDLIDEGERVLDGISRLCGERPADFERRIGPLAKRVEKLYVGRCVPFGGCSLRDEVIGVVRAWLSGQVILPKRKHNQWKNLYWVQPDKEETGLFVQDDPAMQSVSQRSVAIARRVAERVARPVLSAPTHRGGWIDPLALVERLAIWQAAGDEPPTIDAVLALLRLAPDNRPQALKRMSKQSGELADAVRHALGADAIKVGKTAPLWIAAARARDALADDPQVEKHFPSLGPDAGTAAQYTWKYKADPWKHGDQSGVHYRFGLTTTPALPKPVDSELTSVLLHYHSKQTDDVVGVEDVRWSASWWPAGSEAHFAAGAWRLGGNLDWWSAEWANKTYLERLLDPDTPLGEIGTLVLCLGLSSKEPGEHTLAADALAAAINDGRVDGNRLVPTLAKLLTTAGIKPGRWAKVLADVARLSPLHLHVVRTMLENTLAAAPGALNPPLKDVHLLLELLGELLAEAGRSLASESLRQSLSAITGSNKVAKAAKALLAVEGDNVGNIPVEAVHASIEQRIGRARRWMQRTTQ